MPSATPTSAAEQRQGHRLDQELRQDVAPAGADRHAQADLARPLGHRDQHDVHDADAADDQRDRGDRRQQQRQHAGGGLLRRGDLGQVADARNRRPAAAASGGAGAAAAWICRSAAAMSAPSCILTMMAATARRFASLAPSTRLRAVGSGIRITSSWSWPSRLCPLRASTPTTVKGTCLMRISLADRVGVAEELLRHGLAEQRDLGRAIVLRLASRHGPRRPASRARRGSRGRCRR